MPFCRSIPQSLMTALLAWGTINAQTRPTEQQSAPTPNPVASAQVSGSQKSTKHTMRRTYVSSSSLLSGRPARRSRPVVADPPSPYTIAPSPPRISYAEGKLTVVANNSTLSDVLNAIQNATGAKIEGVTPTNADRVFGQFGPASAREVCGALLSGSGYDFIIMEAPENPGSVQQIILTARSTSSPESQDASVPGMPSEQPAASDSDGNQNMADTDDATDGNATAQAPAPQQGEAPQPLQSQENPQAQPATQGQQAQDASAMAPAHPQHWGVHYPPPQQTQQPTPVQPH